MFLHLPRTIDFAVQLKELERRADELNQLQDWKVVDMEKDKAVAVRVCRSATVYKWPVVEATITLPQPLGRVVRCFNSINKQRSRQINPLVNSLVVIKDVSAEAAAAAAGYEQAMYTYMGVDSPSPFLVQPMDSVDLVTLRRDRETITASPGPPDDEPAASSRVVCRDNAF